MVSSSKVKLFDYQKEAVNKLHSGSILCGAVGSGKTLTALSFWKTNFKKRKLFVITTAKKRDTKDWEKDAAALGVKNLVVDSWNNITKYKSISDAFFIFDEQRATEYGTWGKTLIKIAHKNKWILLSATPADNWMDFMPIFVANGFYKNKTAFTTRHVEYDRFQKYPKIVAYHNTDLLMKLRDHILVNMDYHNKNARSHEYLYSDFNKKMYHFVQTAHADPWSRKPLENPSQFTQVIRKIVATDQSRINKLKKVLENEKTAVIFYNYNYELDILRKVLEEDGRSVGEWNGHRHDEIPKGKSWAYLVQYTSGSEGWNCTTTSTMIFYSPNYSYRIMEQSEGRIDRANNKYHDLTYYYLLSHSGIDNSVMKAIKTKKKFNESNWAKRSGAKQ